MLYRASLLNSLDLGYTCSVSWPWIGSHRRANVLTRYRISLSALFATSNEDDILLRSIDVIVFQEEDAVDAVLLQC
jgi:hypothetical protein